MARPTASAPRPAAPWAWAVGGVLLGLLPALLLFAPAHWLAGTVQKASAGRVVMNDPRGTVWNGSAQLLLTGGAGSNDVAALPTRVEWRLRPTWSGLHADIQSACCMPTPLSVQMRLFGPTSAMAIADGHSQWPAAMLSGLGTPWNTLQVEGDLQLATQGLSVEWFEGQLRIAGQAELRAQRLSSRLSTLRPMGSYRITLLGGATPTLQL